MTEEKQIKPLGKKSYGSIPHLPGSRVGPGDYHISEGQAKIATEKTRDKHDIVIVQEKLDGSNVAVAKINGEIIAITRAGYLATSSPFEQHHMFDSWVKEREETFKIFLNEGERVCGEWLALAHGTKYKMYHEPFVAFDIMIGNKRLNYDEFARRCDNALITIPKLLRYGAPMSIEDAMKAVEVSGHGAIDEVEGAIWRVERKGEVDFLCKYVKPTKQDGKYFTELTGMPAVWNWQPAS